MNFEAKKAELKAAGYSLHGGIVYDSAGNPVAGVAAYGQVWCKSADVEAIMSRPAPKTKAKAKQVEPQEVEELEMVRARDENGHYIADDPSTPDVNEAWVVRTVKKAVKKK